MKSEKMKVGKISKRILDLYTMNMITKYHCQLVLKNDYKDLDYTKFLLALTERYLRVKGYYKKYPSEVDLVNDEIRLAIEKFNEERRNI